MARRATMRGFGWTLMAGLIACGMSYGCSDEASKPATSDASATRPAPAAAPSPAGEPKTAPSPAGGEPKTAPAPSPAGGEPKTAPAPSPAGGATAASEPELSAEERIEAGRAVYNANCIACHNMDPSRDGALGPAVAGASLELLEARVLRAQYPDGYEPRRDTRVMVALPHLEPKLPELAAYLASLE